MKKKMVKSNSIITLTFIHQALNRSYLNDIKENTK